MKVKDNNFSNLPVDPPVVSSQEVAATQTVTVPEVVIAEKQPSEDMKGDESNVNLESGNDSEELKLEEAATKVQAAFRAHQVILLLHSSIEISGLILLILCCFLTREGPWRISNP